ncbi:M14 family metallopeptidase [Methylomarinum sp. Ch1-1]|uniref:M14 family metallopeptidase n=1 Tax=Methylomarinum roseum TaxID=3067653 RepID=A0AAU7NUQ9_9GAMM|nr:M14 family metallopeptidase [Methylomarinum sp. Ch1-1]MDP4519176.1 M14 family metallopeptidase [Methylomarinum sp. Ch1-1]
MPIAYDLDCFSDHYSSAREKFLQTCAKQPGQLSSYTHPLNSEELPLATDVFWLGPKQADNVLVVISATHGVEGFCGSAAQIQWLRHEAMPPTDSAVMLIHALNPFGFAYCRRVNEDNIDLNRNFIDFEHIPVNAAYQQLADAILPANQEQFHDGDLLLTDYRKRQGQRALELAISGGQYQFADGLFYGGVRPSWSQRLIETVIADYRLAQRRRLIAVDIHSGLGPYGYGEIISDHNPDSTGASLAKRWFGDSVTEPARGTSTSVPKSGLLDYAWHPLTGDNGCYVTLEFGTYSLAEMFALLREENYCWQRNVNTEKKTMVQQRMRDHFYPAKQDWQEMVLFRSAQVIGQAIQALLE